MKQKHINIILAIVLLLCLAYTAYLHMKFAQLEPLLTAMVETIEHQETMLELHSQLHDLQGDINQEFLNALY